MTFLTILGVMEFKLVLEGKAEVFTRVIKIKLETFSANNFALDAGDNTSGLLDRGGIADLPFAENTVSNLPKVSRAKFLESNGFFCFISICMFSSLKNPLFCNDY